MIEGRPKWSHAFFRQIAKIITKHRIICNLKIVNEALPKIVQFVKSASFGRDLKGELLNYLKINEMEMYGMRLGDSVNDKPILHSPDLGVFRGRPFKEWMHIYAEDDLCWTAEKSPHTDFADIQ